MKSKRYYIINAIILAFTILFFYKILFQNIKMLSQGHAYNMIIVIGVVCIMAIYIIKAIRLYFIMLEKRLTLKRFFRVYTKTTLVNLVFPFKMGEVFRMYCYGNELKNYKASLLLILVDRYFDTIPLLVLLLGFTVLGKNPITSIVLILSVFIVAVTVFYITFPSTYKYLNRYLIMNTNSERGIWALDILKKISYWYLYVKELVVGRVVILLVLSACAWLTECVALYCLVIGLGNRFAITDFLLYMNSVFLGDGNLYVNLYIGISAILLIGQAGIIYGRQWFRRKRQ